MIVIVGLACVFPLAVYCFILALVNRRHHPVLVSGPWDFAGVLFAASGFLLVAGPCILSGLYEHLRAYQLFSQPSFPIEELGDLLWAGYFAVIVAGASFLLIRRRRVLSIYNVDAGVTDDALGQVFDQLKLEWARTGQRILLGACSLLTEGSNGTPVPSIPAPQPSAVTADSVAAVARAGGETRENCGPDEHLPLPARPRPLELLLRLDPSPAMRHVNLCWTPGAGALRQEIETKLAKVLAGVRTRYNPVGLWLGSLAGCLFSALFFALLFLIIVTMIRFKHS